MGLYDRIEFDESVFDLEPDRGNWQTKDLQRRPAMDTFRVTADGHLLREAGEYVEVPEEERPYYDEEIGGFEEDWHRVAGTLRWEPDGWDRLYDYHGRFEFYGTVDDEYRRFEATFTHGELEFIEPVIE